jgi:hypothetical protein
MTKATVDPAQTAVSVRRHRSDDRSCGRSLVGRFDAAQVVKSSSKLHVKLSSGGLAMRYTLVIAAALLSASAHAAAPPDHFRVRTAGDLAKVCSTPSSDPDAVSAIAFCHGVLTGAYGYFEAATPAADRFVCVPNPSPTRSQVANGFVAWLKARPNLANDGAIDALFRYAAEAFPCKR